MLTRLRHYAAHGTVGVAIWRAAIALRRRERDAWLALGLVAFGRCHLDHHPRARRTP